MEYCYKIKLPPLEQIISEKGKMTLRSFKDSRQYYKVFKVEDILKQEYLNILGGDWIFCLTFFKDKNTKGEIHIDDAKIPLVWGVSWIITGEGTLEYWKPENIDTMETIKDNQNIVKTVYSTSKPPDRVYHQKAGEGYLVNASIPHLGTGDSRMVISLRQKLTAYNQTWEEVVDRYKDLIE